MGAPDENAFIAELTARIGQIPTSDHPYWAASGIAGRAVDAALEPDAVGREVYLLWAALQDWVELRNDKVEAVRAMRSAATEWPAVVGDDEALESYFARWRELVRAAFLRPDPDPVPDVVLGGLEGLVTEYSSDTGFIRGDSGGPTWLFSWEAVQSDAHFKTIDADTRVRFEGRVTSTGERIAEDVTPIAPISR